MLVISDWLERLGPYLPLRGRWLLRSAVVILVLLLLVGQHVDGAPPEAQSWYFRPPCGCGSMIHFFE